MRGLLDNELLSGPYEVSTRLRPTRYAWPVADDDVIGLMSRIEWLCQVWGGAGQPLLPVHDGQIPVHYNRLLQTEQIDYVAGNLDVVTPRRVELSGTWETLMIIVAMKEPRDRWTRPVEVVDLAEDDPWRPIYSALLGRLPASPDPGLLEMHLLRDDLTFDQFFPVRRTRATGSLQDLLMRLEDFEHHTVRQFSGLYLASGLEPDTGFHGHNPVMPTPFPKRRAAGPNIIVAVDPGSVDDIALLWNLRAAHGDRRVMPIGIPSTLITADMLRDLQKPGRATQFGFAGGACHITSSSIDVSELNEIVSDVPGIVIASPKELLTFGPAPGRPGSQVGFFSDGQARLASMNGDDRDVLRTIQQATRASEIVIDVRVRDRLLPADGTMRGNRHFESYRGGAAQVTLSRLRGDGTVEVTWPPSWTGPCGSCTEPQSGCRSFGARACCYHPVGIVGRD